MKSPSSTSSLRGVITFAPRAYLFTSSPIRSLRPSRSFGTSVTSRKSDSSSSKSAPPSPFNSFGGGPAPPRLPKEEQEIFEALQRSSTGAFSTPRTPPPKINQSPHSGPAEAAHAQTKVEERVDKIQAESASRQKDLGDSMSNFVKEQFDRTKIDARGDGEELHPNIVRGAQPEFEGDVNPKTGEVGGPKNEPLRWGASGEWSYNGRTTDF
ncbi:hypothetical protein LTS17_004208 [Exophiala oligosperma]